MADEKSTPGNKSPRSSRSDNLKIAFLSAALAEIESRWPKKSVTIARVLIQLMHSGSSTPADIGEALGHGRDSTTIQQCCADLATLGIARSTATRPTRLTLLPPREWFNKFLKLHDEHSLRQAAQRIGISPIALIRQLDHHGVDIADFRAKSRRKIDYDQFATMAARGARATEIAAAFDVSPSTVGQFAARHGISVVTQQRGRRGKIDRERFVQMAARGASLTQITEAFGVTKQAAWSFSQRHGIPVVRQKPNHNGHKT